MNSLSPRLPIAADRFLITWLAPLALVLVCTGLLWLPERGIYPRLFYLGIVCAVFLAATRPRELGAMIREPIFVAVFAFAGYFSLTLAWSAAEESAGALLGRQGQVLLLFVLTFFLGRSHFPGLVRAVAFSALLAIPLAIVEIAGFLAAGGAGRLSSKGALSNPLLISHIYGFFAALWLAWLFTEQGALRRFAALIALAPIVLLMLLTGSRTPLVAFAASFLALVVLVVRGRRAALTVIGLTFLAASLVFLMPDTLAARGLSYRPEIWSNVLLQAREHLWAGHGLGAALTVQLPDFTYAFRDPHNMTLSVLYRGGLIGLILWGSLYVIALGSSWRGRGDRWVVVAAAAVVYGLFAGMTEGGALFPRPKEHWFLTWIPLSLLLAAIDRWKRDARNP